MRESVGDLREGLPETRKALAFAQRRHAGQLRAVDGAPFIEHPLEVALLLLVAGSADHVIAAGILHELLEDTPVTAAQLQRRFGVRIGSLVIALTEDPSITGHARRKAALRDQVAAAGEEALAVFAADKISKVRELRLEASHTIRRTSLQRARLRHYRRSLELLERLLPDSPLVPQLRDELEQLTWAQPERRPEPANYWSAEYRSA